MTGISKTVGLITHSFVVFRRDIGRRLFFGKEFEILAYLEGMRDTGGQFSAIDNFPEVDDFWELKGARRLDGEQMRRVRKIFIGKELCQ